MNMNKVFGLFKILKYTNKLFHISSKLGANKIYPYKNTLNENLNLEKSVQKYIDEGNLSSTMELVYKSGHEMDKELLLNIMRNVPLEKVEYIDNLLHFLPEFTNDVINEYLNRNYLEKALLLFKNHQDITFATLKKLETMSQKNFMFYLLKRYLKEDVKQFNDENDFPHFQHLFEFAIFENFTNLSKIINTLCYAKKYRESYEIMAYHNFDKRIILTKESIEELEKYVDSEDFKNDEKEIKYNSKLKLIDSFGPHSEENLELELDESQIIIIKNAEDIGLLDKLKNSEVIGIDCEWKPSKFKDSFKKISIMQLSTEDCVLIIDMLAIEKSEDSKKKIFEQFYKILRNLNKTFITNSFQNDMKLFDQNLNSFFKNSQVIDILKFYSEKTGKKETMQRICTEYFGKRLCKVEQCSNWEIRPLRKKQIHYAALDAFILLKLYNQINNITNTAI